MGLKQNLDYTITYVNDRLKKDDQFKNLFPNIEESIETVVEIPNAYIKIMALSGDKDSIQYTLGIYTDVSSSTLIDTKTYEFVPDVSTSSTTNYHVQAYNDAKNKPEFAYAIDC